MKGFVAPISFDTSISSRPRKDLQSYRIESNGHQRDCQQDGQKHYQHASNVQGCVEPARPFRIQLHMLHL
jgi:hypothetical protein